MKQHLTFPYRPVRRSNLADPDRWHPAAPGRFRLQVRLRGQTGPAWQVACTGLEQAIRFGEAEFPAFAERNPWIGLDSLQRQIWILLDPETEDSGASNA